ncbi:hypothetical protein JRT4AKPX_JRT4AKP_02541 [Klebsiella pneumoniae]|nr:hypothetical protein JRT4AKPX_JRT4AKP_02541 [Klebsiella pneumoniae]
MIQPADQPHLARPFTDDHATRQKGFGVSPDRTLNIIGNAHRQHQVGSYRVAPHNEELVAIKLTHGHGRMCG